MPIIELSTLLVTLIVCSANDFSKNICLQEYGTYPVNWDDNVLVFYVTLKNDGDIPIMVSVKMIECCEQFLTNDDTSCNHMRLDGSRVQLNKYSVTNSTLLYPNFYPYNRKGICSINITFYNNQSDAVELLQNIPFDTTIQAEDLFLLQESMLNIKKPFKLCESPDEDPLDLCAPVNCYMKYQGFRNSFDSVKRQCVPIPVCNSGPNISSPNIVYDPYNNNCIAVNDDISVTDIDCVLHETLNKSLRYRTKTKEPYHSNIRCHHGKMDETNRTCVCNDGWTSKLNWSFPIVSTVPVHMCTIRIHSKNLCNFFTTMTTLDSINIVSFSKHYIN